MSVLETLALSERDIFWDNILLLGLDVSAARAKYPGVALGPDMFSKQSQKGMEIIMYFLLTNVLGDDAVKVGCEICCVAMSNGSNSRA
jgi:HAUS augmin-like complex subunit 6-like protein